MSQNSAKQLVSDISEEINDLRSEIESVKSISKIEPMLNTSN
jgi:hypothetical protein